MNKICTQTVKRAILGAIVALNAASILPTTGMAQESDMVWGFYDKKQVKWSTNVPGYDPHIIKGRRLADNLISGVKFKMKWPQNGLVAGHANITSPLTVSAAEAAVKLAIGSQLGAMAKDAFRVASWSRNLAMKANNYKQIIPMGVCEATSGKTGDGKALKGGLGQFDPETDVCYIAYYNGYGWTIEETKSFKVLVATPVLATWVPKSEVKKNEKALFDGKYLYYQNDSRAKPHLTKSICRATFNPALAKAAAVINNTGLFKLADKSELLIGTVFHQDRSDGGTCVHPYKDFLAGSRYPVISKDYEVLVVETDNMNLQRPFYSLRNIPIALKNAATGKCLAIGKDKKPSLVTCGQESTAAN